MFENQDLSSVYTRPCGCDQCSGVVTSRRREPSPYPFQSGGKTYMILRSHGRVLAVYRVTWRGKLKQLRPDQWPTELKI